jgi:hypothetical protein
LPGIKNESKEMLAARRSVQHSRVRSTPTGYPNPFALALRARIIASYVS